MTKGLREVSEASGGPCDGLREVNETPNREPYEASEGRGGRRNPESGTTQAV